MQSPQRRNVFEVLQEQASRRPDRPAVITADAVISYGELAKRATKAAAALAGADGVAAELEPRLLRLISVVFGAVALVALGLAAFVAGASILLTFPVH